MELLNTDYTAANGQIQPPTRKPNRKERRKNVKMKNKKMTKARKKSKAHFDNYVHQVRVEVARKHLGLNPY